MAKKTLIVVAILVFFVCMAGYGENIVGIVEDGESSSSLEFVNVVGLGADSTFVAGTVTDSVGRFALPGDGIALLNIKMIGYEEQTIQINEYCGEPLTISMQPKQTMLKEVAVTAKTTATRLVEGDMVTSVENTPLANMPTVFETLSFIPMLSVQGENVTVFGKGSPVFYVNGRQVRDQSDLNTLQPSEIASIRVVTNPGSRYGGDVNAVVLIKTKKRGGEGFSGWIQEEMSLNGQFSNTAGAYLQYRWRGLELFVRVFQNHSNSESTMDYVSDIFSQTHRRQEFSTRFIDKGNGLNGKIGFSYDFHSNHSIGGAYYVLWNNRKRDVSSDTKLVEAGMVDDWCQYEEEDAKIWPLHNANVYYEGKISDLAISSNFDYQGIYSNTDARYDEFGGVQPARSFSTQGASSSRLLAENLILTYPVKNAEFSLGQEWTGTNYKSNFFCPDGVMKPGYSENDESTVALFMSWKQRISKFFWEIGLRYEHRRVKYDASDEAYEEVYENLFPSVKFGAVFGRFSWDVGYRYYKYPPNYSMMNGEIMYVNRYTYQSGNPQLKSIRQQQVYLNAQYKDFWLQSGYQNQKMPIIHMSLFYEPDPDIILQRWENLPELKSMYVSGGYQTAIRHWRPSVSVGFQKQFLHIEVNHHNMNMSQPIYTIGFDNTLELPWGIAIYGNYRFRSSGDRQLSHMRYAHMLTVGISKSFLKNMLTIQLYGKDLLNQEINRFTSYSQAVVDSGVSDFGHRKVQLFVRYALNATRSRYKGRGAGAAEKNRL